MSIADEETIDTFSQNSKDSNNQVEFADVVEKLSFAINNVRQLKPWKDRAVKAESENRKLTVELRRLKDELLDSEYEVEKWKKRALRAEQENQDEIIKWKNKARKIRSSQGFIAPIDKRSDAIALLDVGDADSYTHLVSERDDDNSTISTHRDDDVKLVKGSGSFRSKWKNMGFEEEKERRGDESFKEPKFDFDDNTTLAAEEIVKKYEQGIMSKSKTSAGKPADDNSAVEAEEILNNYLNMKGRYNTRRFDSSRTIQGTRSKFSNSTSGAVYNVISEEVEI